MLHEINDSQKYMRTQVLNVYHSAKKNVFQTHVTEKRENLIDDALSYAKKCVKILVFQCNLLHENRENAFLVTVTEAKIKPCRMKMS